MAALLVDRQAQFGRCALPHKGLAQQEQPLAILFVLRYMAQQSLHQQDRVVIGFVHLRDQAAERQKDGLAPVAVVDARPHLLQPVGTATGCNPAPRQIFLQGVVGEAETQTVFDVD